MKRIIVLMFASMGFGSALTIALTKPPVIALIVARLIEWVGVNVLGRAL